MGWLNRAAINNQVGVFGVGQGVPVPLDLYLSLLLIIWHILENLTISRHRPIHLRTGRWTASVKALNRAAFPREYRFHRQRTILRETYYWCLRPFRTGASGSCAFVEVSVTLYLLCSINAVLQAPSDQSSKWTGWGLHSFWAAAFVFAHRQSLRDT